MKGKKVRPITPKVQVTPKKPKPKYMTVAQTQTQEWDAFEGASSTCAICGFSANKKEKKKSAVRGELKFHPCVASVCLKCLQHAMDQQYACGITQVFCPLCLRPFTDSERGRIHPDLNNRISEQMTLSNLGNVVECRFCSNKFLFEPTSADVAKNESYKGRKLTQGQIECAAKNFMLCNECRISSCAECGAVPYHIGETCKEHQWYVQGYICRICGRAADPEGADQIARLTCGHEDCVKAASEMCDHVHPCGHACVGMKGETNHPDCPECSIGGSLCPQCGGDLWGKLCLKLECGHTIHLDCGLEIIGRSTTGPVLDLPLCPAAGCGAFVKHPELEARAREKYHDWMRMERHLIDPLARRRVAAEGIEYHPEVVSKSSPFSAAGSLASLYWAKKNLRFMICSKHNERFVYTLGRKDDKAVDPKAVSCPNCPSYSFPQCRLHGAYHMQYKCDACCSVGVHLSENRRKSGGGALCWYCEICYDMPGRVEIASKKPCKGNCRFAPHQWATNDYYGRCDHCGEIFHRAKPYTRV